MAFWFLLFTSYFLLSCPAQPQPQPTDNLSWVHSSIFCDISERTVLVVYDWPVPKGTNEKQNRTVYDWVFNLCMSRMGRQNRTFMTDSYLPTDDDSSSEDWSTISPLYSILYSMDWLYGFRSLPVPQTLYVCGLSQKPTKAPKGTNHGISTYIGT